jgi:hypothetical protein
MATEHPTTSRRLILAAVPAAALASPVAAFPAPDNEKGDRLADHRLHERMKRLEATIEASEDDNKIEVLCDLASLDPIAPRDT